MNERDLKQKTFGTIGFSLLAHTGLIAILVFSQQPSASEVAAPDHIIAAEATQDDSPIEVAANDDTPRVAPDEEEVATITEAPELESVPEPTPEPKRIALQKAKPAPKKSEPPPEKLTPDIEQPVNERAELAAANADTNTDTPPKPKATKPTPTVIPHRHQAKSDDRSEATPAPIISSYDQQPTQSARVERSGAVVAAPSAKDTVSGSTTSADDTATPVKREPPKDAEIRDAETLTTLSTKPFNYPSADRESKRSGTVFLVARIKADGSITDVQIERSSGSKSMDQEAVKTFKQWKFSPEDEGYVRKAVQFVLKDDDSDESFKDEL